MGPGSTATHQSHAQERYKYNCRDRPIRTALPTLVRGAGHLRLTPQPWATAQFATASAHAQAGPNFCRPSQVGGATNIDNEDPSYTLAILCCSWMSSRSVARAAATSDPTLLSSSSKGTLFALTPLRNPLARSSELLAIKRSMCLGWEGGRGPKDGGCLYQGTVAESRKGRWVNANDAARWFILVCHRDVTCLASWLTARPGPTSRATS